jgi:hypothetical protein
VEAELVPVEAVVGDLVALGTALEEVPPVASWTEQWRIRNTEPGCVSWSVAT